ncbi:MAG: nitrophenyl compound nitroreductase subunit ArsF family protein [bacterium]
MKPKSNIKLKMIIPIGILVLVFGSPSWLMAQGSSSQGQGRAAKPGPAVVSEQAATKGRGEASKVQESASKEQAETSKGQGSDSGKAADQLSHKVIAYYFHGKFRCVSCRKIESYTHEAIQGQGGFAGPLKSGRLEWRVIDVEEPVNEHFVKDFQLYTKSVVIVDVLDGKQKRWKNLARVWELLYDKDTFINYVRDEINAYLAGET